ncbi:hypothetical protein FOZ63_003019 [Perkinsus olseni]|uniref:Uncharacterized protein n=1 Tax=Perkinsus olseni TaxID=32597 RepID=A0A7J6T8S0_PEROL|nr:hypothetical protein FOZ63_003019 [Perkinsus olseni]KAF4741331.1 hypothetical protein FOZ62_031528 [Perkinsus olseni]
MPSLSSYAAKVTLALHLVEGRLTSQKIRDNPVQTKAPVAGAKQQATNRVATLSDREDQFCEVGIDAEGAVNFIVQETANTEFGFLLDAALKPELTRIYKGGHDFSIAGQEAPNITATEMTNTREGKNTGGTSAGNEIKTKTRVPSLQHHLMKEITGIPPWGREMLYRLKMRGETNLVPFPSEVPFPTPPSSKLKYLDLPREGCEAVAMRFIRRDLPKRKALFIQWVTWFKLDIPVPEEGFKITRVSTSIDRYIPEMKLEFSEDRLRELEGGADRVIPDPTRLSNNSYMLEMCDKQYRNYGEYIAQKEGIPEADLVDDNDISMGTVLWLLTGKVFPFLPDNIDHHFFPYSTLYYKDAYRAAEDWQLRFRRFMSLSGKVKKGIELYYD